MTTGREDEEQQIEAEADELIEEHLKPLYDALDELEQSFGKKD